MAQALETESKINSICISGDGNIKIDSLSTESASALFELQNAGVPIAQVVRTNDVHILLERFGEIIFNNGTQGRTGAKQQTLELSRLLPHRCSKDACKPDCEKIELIQASYQNDGRTLQGIRTLLKKPKSGRHLFLIGVNDAIFEALLRRACTSSANNFSHPCFLQRIKDDPALAKMYKGDQPEFIKVRKQILAAADNSLPVLIQGESGTGKELVARAIHSLSERSKTGDFVALDSGAISHYLLEAELFGVEPGIVAGVSRLKKGLWEEADQGTLFLDEIGNMSLDHQARILRALETKEIRRVGGLKSKKVDARIIAATNKDILGMIARGEFLADLYPRLSVLEIYTPALRQCPAALKNLAQDEWRKIRRNEDVKLPMEIIEELSNYTILSNYRGLLNALNRLNAYMSAEDLDRVDRAYFVEAMKKPPSPVPAIGGVVTREGTAAYRTECLQNLRQAARSIRKCKVVLRPVLRGQTVDNTSLNHVLAEIEQPHADLDKFCLDPSAFYSHEIHSELSKFTGRLAGLIDQMRENHGKPVEYWEKDLQKQYDLVLTLMQYEIRQLDRA